MLAGRYKSLCVEKEGYLLELSRYLHLNPVRAGMVKKPEEYEWSSYGQYIGKANVAPWLKRQWLLAEYGKTYQGYRVFVEAGIGQPPGYPAERIVGQAVMGGEGFIRKVVQTMQGEKRVGDVTARWHFTVEPTLEEIYRAVYDHYGRGDQLAPRAQDTFVRLAEEESSGLNREIAEKLGGKSPSAVAHQYRRAIRKMEADRKLQRAYERDRSTIMSLFKG